MAWIQYQETAEWVLFIGTFLAVAVWETLLPQRKLDWPAARRWGGHAVLYAVSGIAGAVVIRVSAVVVAVMAANSRLGLLNKSWLPYVFRFVLALILLDLLRYATHRVLHSVPFLWRIHEVHHSDPDYDVSTAARFHPIEVLLDQALFLAAVFILSPPPVAVFVSELITTAMNLFVHANASLPSWMESMLRRAIVTPDLHRIHHSVEIEDQSRNFGQTFSCWDRLFGTFQEGRGGRKGQERQAFPTGVKGLRDQASLGIGFMLSEPFLRQRGSRSDKATLPLP